MKLLTLNCHSWQEEEQLNKIKLLAKTIKDKKYDVISLQEVSQHMDSSVKSDIINEDNNIEVLLNELKELGIDDYSYVWDFSHIGYDIYEEGIAILSKHPIVSKKSFYVSKDTTINNYKSRKIVSAKIKINNELVDFYSCHLGWWNDDTEPFENQVNNLLENASNDNLTFFMGDFNNNAFIRGEGYDYLLSKGLIDTYSVAEEKDSGITVPGEIDGWNGCKEKKRLDLILCNKNINIKKSIVVFNKENNIVSDHYGVEIEI